MANAYADRTVWITGASSGIGAALAVAFAREGARVLLSARRVERLEEARNRCPQPERHSIVPLDLGRPDSLPELAAEVLERHGPIDVLVHAGGVSQRSPAKDTELAVDRRLMEVNYFGTVGLTKAVLPSMLDRGSGIIVPISSVVGKFGTPLRSGYAASKHALHGFFDALRAETHGRGVQITVVCPGFVRTELSLHALTADGSEQGHVDRAHTKGMDPDVCARKILAAIAAGKSEVNVGGREVLGVYLKRWLPSVFDRVIRRVRVT